MNCVIKTIGSFEESDDIAVTIREALRDMKGNYLPNTSDDVEFSRGTNLSDVSKWDSIELVSASTESDSTRLLPWAMYLLEDEPDKNNSELHILSYMLYIEIESGVLRKGCYEKTEGRPERDFGDNSVTEDFITIDDDPETGVEKIHISMDGIEINVESPSPKDLKI